MNDKMLFAQVDSIRVFKNVDPNDTFSNMRDLENFNEKNNFNKIYES